MKKLNTDVRYQAPIPATMKIFEFIISSDAGVITGNFDRKCTNPEMNCYYPILMNYLWVVTCYSES